MRRLVVVVVVALACAAPASAAAADSNPYATAPFTVTTYPFTFGQDPVFMPDGRVVVGEDFKQGDGTQIYLHNFDGSHVKCLTCQLPSPNNVPIVRPQGDWILFHSWMGHHIVLGSPGYGGIGSALFAMRPDGSQVTRLTGTDPAHGAGEGEDAYHAYWSPDGRQVEWANFNGNFIDNNGTNTWDVRVADFVDTGSGPPHLANIRVVRPPNDDWYETQWWAPDGSGFLYTETFGSAVTPELFFCRLTAAGCQTTQLTNSPSWNEQAIFTPDMKDVIFMSSRDHPGFFNTFAEAARDSGLPTSFDNFLILPVFEAAFLQPVAEEATDLYELDLTTGSVRRLTTDGNDGWIIPEFTWDPKNNFLMWTEARIHPGVSVLEPVDLGRQLANEISLVQNPPPTPAPTVSGGNALDAGLPLQRRTRILRFALPGAPAVAAPGSPGPLTCAAGRRLTFRLRPVPHGRVTAVVVSVNGRVLLRHRARNIRTVGLPRPAGSNLVVTITSTNNRGGRVVTHRTFRGCMRTRVVGRVHRHGRQRAH
jgi:Tol biopolymer transport system component